MKSPIYLFSTSSNPRTINVNSLEINFLKPEIDFLKYDYFILTSKQATLSLKQYKNVQLKPALCISQLTAKSYEAIGGEVLDIGLGYGDSLERKIEKYSSSVQWLYLRAEIIASNFVQKLQKNKYSIDEKITYASKCSQEIRDIEIQDNATLIFTSPSSVKCFLKHHIINPSFKIIVIGQTTAKSLPKSSQFLISKEKTIESCLLLA
ncbi:MAG: uroporphyrinogen-III synthase [Sulfurimonas sp.]|nr:uroporphyrinogen-III synthase [Sulfurimonas sp.]